jgi:hypothetical protein
VLLFRATSFFATRFPKKTFERASETRTQKTKTKHEKQIKFGSIGYHTTPVISLYVVLFSTPVCSGTRFSHTHAHKTYLFVPLSLVNFIPPRNKFSSRETTIEQQSSRRTTTRTLDRERRRRREVLKRACRREIGFRITFSLLEFLSLYLSLARAKQIQSTDAHQIPKISLLLYPSWSSSSYNKS